ncbi:hypothetical protein [Legionella shakespearei]|uniref:Coiled-coil protein n=1 Tax=Legionella shakespearei DSM 23087 TaxID=1122169 RepID=A0A0W0YKS2_9GAMM|nr:hypothetical protein [Legionella shakespearei]KTD57516.1 coiled-coil protein [Legionella shakespearei DSM 23087]
MTIFIKAAKTLILRCLDQSMKESSAADQGWFGGLRNADLSEKQRNLTLKLRRAVEDYASDESDKKNLENLKELVLGIDTEVEKIRKEAAYTRGHLNDTLTKINSDLDRFCNVLSGLSYKLIDIPSDDDPFHILCAHSAFYFGENIFTPTEDGVLTKAFTAVGGASTVEIREKKEACLLLHLTACEKKLLAIKDGYEDARKEAVLLEIQAIQRDNAKICVGSQVSSAIPVSVGFFATAQVSTPTIKPSRGRLEVSMQNAINEIDPTNSILKQSSFAM